MPSHRLTLEEKEKLIREERKRRLLARQKQVRAQCDEFTRELNSAVIAEERVVVRAIRSEVENEVSCRMEELIENGGSVPRRRSGRIAVAEKMTHVSKNSTNISRRSIGKSKSKHSTKHAENQSRPKHRAMTRKDAELAVRRGAAAEHRLRNCQQSEKQRREEAVRRMKMAKERANLVMRHGALVVENNV